MIRLLQALFVMICLCCRSLPCAAQTDAYEDIPRTGFAYARVGIGIGSPYAFRAAVDFIAKGRHELSLGYTGLTRKSPGVPKDAPVPDKLINLPVGKFPQETMEGFTVGYGFVLYPRRSPVKNRYILRASILFGSRQDLTNVRMSPNPDRYAYTYDIGTYRATGILLEPGFQLISGRGFGWAFAPYVMVNNHLSGVGMSVSMLLGYVSNYRHHSKYP